MRLVATGPTCSTSGRVDASGPAAGRPVRSWPRAPGRRALRRQRHVPLGRHVEGRGGGRALAAGAAIVNDVTVCADPEMASGGRSAPGRADAPDGPCRCTTTSATTTSSGRSPPTSRTTVARAAAGARRPRVVVDPGLGFGKSVAHNLALLAGVDELRGAGRPVLVGPSRKRFLGVIIGHGRDEAAPSAPWRDGHRRARRRAHFPRARRQTQLRGVAGRARRARGRHRSLT